MKSLWLGGVNVDVSPKVWYLLSVIMVYHTIFEEDLHEISGGLNFFFPFNSMLIRHRHVSS